MGQTLDFNQRVSFTLKKLYDRYGYSQYKMSKFEEYDLYARNKDFLISDSVITFTDTNGKLMALKPDVTLSIVKNSKDTPNTVQKLYYNENIYRVAKGTNAFKESTQVGLECLGNVDDYCICEVLTLAAQSLRAISADSILEISHLGLLSQILDGIGIPKEGKDTLLKLIGQKNLHELEAVCRSFGASEAAISLLKSLIATCGAPITVLPKLEALLGGIAAEPFAQLGRVLTALADSDIGDMLRFDFSVVDDIHYYNGFVCKGFIAGLPNSVLSGGQYDKLMQKMKRSSGAMGFAVYMDELQLLEPKQDAYDVDMLLLYDDSVSISQIRTLVDTLSEVGSVMAQRNIPEGIRYRKLAKISGKEVMILEENA